MAKQSKTSVIRQSLVDVLNTNEATPAEALTALSMVLVENMLNMKKEKAELIDAIDFAWRELGDRN
jgi:hypothetical protein